MMIKIFRILVIIAGLILAACSTSKQEASEMPFENTKWVLDSLNGKSVNEWQYAQTPPHITFEANTHKFTAYGGCNNMFGEYLTKDGNFSIDMVGATKKWCGDGNIEDDFYSALTAAISREVKRNKLLMYDHSGTPILIFSAEE